MAPEIEALNYQNYIKDFLEKDLTLPSYQRQRDIFNKENDLNAVIDDLCSEFDKDLVTNP